MSGVPTESSGSQAAEVTHRRGLECFVGKARVAIPVERVEQIIEYERFPPPPLARRWVGGLALYQGRVMLSVSLVSATEPSVGPRTARGVVLGVPDSEVGWILEVGSVGAFVQAALATRRTVPETSKLPSWVSAGRTPDAKSIGWIDVAAMVRELVGSA